MMVMYHTGVYNLHRRRAWSCCGEEQEKSEGCSPVGSLESCEFEYYITVGNSGIIYLQCNKSHSKLSCRFSWA